jgi:hypothetical protein
MRPRVAVEQQDRRSGASMAHANDDIAKFDSVERKTVEHWPSIRSGRFLLPPAVRMRRSVCGNEDLLTGRSGMTRRVARLVDEGLVRRSEANADGRGVVVALIDAGVARLAETVPAHARGIVGYLVSRLDDQELAVLESALNKVTVDCTFG